MLKSIDEFQVPINEKEGFLDWLTGKKETDTPPANPQPGQESGIGETSLNEFYKDLQDFINSKKSMTVQSSQNMQYSKMVEEIQEALEFLGYKLPRFGVDGLFGPETAAAITSFNANTETPEVQPTNEIKMFQAFSKIYEEATAVQTATSVVPKTVTIDSDFVQRLMNALKAKNFTQTDLEKHVADKPATDSTGLRNAYPNAPILAFRSTKVPMGKVTDYMKTIVQSGKYPKEVVKAAYIMFRNESGNGKHGVNNNYAGIQADSGSWSKYLDPSQVIGTCVVSDALQPRRFVCFDDENGYKISIDLLCKVAQQRRIYVQNDIMDLLDGYFGRYGSSLGSLGAYVNWYNQKASETNKPGTSAGAISQNVINMYNDATTLLG